MSSTSSRAYQKLEVPHSRKDGHGLSIGLRRNGCDLAPLPEIELAAATGDRKAGNEALHVPLERARQGLVEVVDAEHQAAVGGGIETEVREVGIAAELNHQPGPRRSRQIGGHQQGTAPVERKRRREHPAVSQRHQVSKAALRLLFEKGDRVGTVGRIRFGGERRPGDSKPDAPPVLAALRRVGMVAEYRAVLAGFHRTTFCVNPVIGLAVIAADPDPAPPDGRPGERG